MLGSEWATKLENAVIDSNYRVAARRGWDSITTSPASDDFSQLHSYLIQSGTEKIIASSATKLYSSADGAAWTDRSGSLTFTAGNWQFANFNNICYAIQQGEDLIKATSGDFASVTATNVPSGNCLLSAYGRLWAADDNGTDLRYSALLAGDDWDSADAGVLDLTNVWPGTDSIVALAAFNGALVVFGRKNIVIYVDPAGSELGIDPTAIVVSDLITGTGCIARDSVQSVEGDLWFLSNSGLQSLGRLIIQKSNPLNNLSRNVQDEIDRRVAAAGTSLGTARSVYSPRDKLYLLSIPVTGGGGGVVAFDTNGMLEDGSARCVGVWTLMPSAFALLENHTVIMSMDSVTGEVGVYRGGLDDGANFNFIYESGWLDLTKEGYLIIPKRYKGTFFTDATTSVDFGWAFDFSDEFRTASRTFEAAGDTPEFGESEFGVAEFGGGVALRGGYVPGSGTGQFIRLGISAQIDGQQFAIQQLDIYAKVGRYA